MNLKRKALDLVREMKTISPILLIKKFRISEKEAQELSEWANEEYKTRCENTERTRFSMAVRANGFRKMLPYKERPKRKAVT